MKSVNKVILIGTIGRDPEVRSTSGGKQVANFTIATNDRYKDKRGEWQESTEWHRIVVWERLAEVVRDYAKKGDRIYIEGALKTNSWGDKQTGEMKYSTEIWANDVVLLGGKREESSSSAATGNGRGR